MKRLLVQARGQIERGKIKLGFLDQQERNFIVLFNNDYRAVVKSLQDISLTALRI